MKGLRLGLGLSGVATTSGPASWTPASLSNLAAWYDADQQTDGADAAVATFTDRSGNAHHFSQATGVSKPLLRHAAINGKKALDFDGIASNMTCATGLMNGATAGAFFAVVKLDADPPASGGGIVAPGGPVLTEFSSGTFDNHHPYTDGTIYDGFGSTVRKTCGNPTPALTSTSLLAAISGSADYRFLVNNTSLFSTATNTVGFGTNTRKMGLNATGLEFLAGIIAEVIIMSAVPSAGDITNIVSYVNTKYGTSF